MGVYFDYFRAADDETARATHGRVGGPLHAADGGNPPFDGVATKGIFHSPHLEQLVTLAQGAPFSSRPKSTLLWPPPDTPPPVDETSLWLTDPSVDRLDTRIRDGLADIDAARAPALADGWVPELGAGFTVPDVTQVVIDLGALARRAREAGQALYCWATL
ncbi:hypothetical protein [Intrasporangium flavum]|uniref:hypothetical protein n=1 Tax=Intrasporangium flavum TaxID=1428657 RepID=UPI001A977129|nr:hypothetical protein [Intrasporangium flavum]